MPLIADSDLPAFSRLRAEGFEVLNAPLPGDAVPALHIGFLNMMPDAALQATERQFLRLVSAYTRVVNVHVHPFSCAGIEREGEARLHMDRFYESFDSLRSRGIDALIITGANPKLADITAESFWGGLCEVASWAREQVASVLCSCLATHALLKQFHRIERIPLPEKRWGVYAHRVSTRSHPLLRNVNTRFDAPHSHLNEVTREQIESTGAQVLVESEEAGVHLAVSDDGLAFVYFQGHPEYDTNSLLKEYKRELRRFLSREREDYPPYPDHYFPAPAVALLERYRKTAESARDPNRLQAFPEEELHDLVDNTWGDTGRALFDNWLGMVCDRAHGPR